MEMRVWRNFVFEVRGVALAKYGKFPKLVVDITFIQLAPQPLNLSFPFAHIGIIRYQCYQCNQENLFLQKVNFQEFQYVYWEATFPGSKFPGKRTFLGSKLFGEVNFSGRSTFPVGQLTREVNFPRKSTYFSIIPKAIISKEYRVKYLGRAFWSQNLFV